MAKITLELPDDLTEQLAQVGERLPELLALSLKQPPLPAQVYQHILTFIVSNPTPQAMADFAPTDEMQQRLKILLARSQAQELTPQEQQELNEYERIEHIVVMLKTNNLQFLKSVQA